MNLPLVLTIAALPWALLHGQTPAPAAKEEKTSVRTLRVLIAGQRPMPVFEQQGNQYVEVEPPTQAIAPNALELLDAPPTADKNTDRSADKSADPSKNARKMVWPNEVVTLGRYHCPATVRLRLLRTLAKKPHSPPELICVLGELLDPLIVISAEDGGQGWDHPQARVIDLAPTSVPARTVLALNLTRIPLTTRFEAAQGALAPGALQLLHLPATATDVFRFRIDAQSKSGMVPVANSSYQLGASDRLILLAIPNSQVAPGAPPLSLQMIPCKATP